MASKTRSARGEIVDFDLLKIKQQMSQAPKTTSVKAREDFVDAKFRRRVKQARQKVAVEKVEVEVDKKITTTVDENKDGTTKPTKPAKAIKTNP